MRREFGDERVVAATAKRRRVARCTYAALATLVAARTRLVGAVGYRLFRSRCCFLLHRRWHRARARRRLILAELQTLANKHSDDDVAYASSLHQLLRRAARRYALDAHQRQGEDWREVLARVPVDTATLDKLMTLDARMYQPCAEFDRTGVQAAVYRWLDTALRHEKAVAGSAKHA